MDARKEKLDSTEVWDRIKTAQSIHVAKGKKVDVFDPNVDTQDAILKAIMGRSGNLRAPTLQFGDTFFVGFNASLYDAIPRT
jgi:triphosphoribosyl-dephospho-CoA synthetase